MPSRSTIGRAAARPAVVEPNTSQGIRPGGVLYEMAARKRPFEAATP
jgi:hypothetical protein